MLIANPLSRRRAYYSPARAQIAKNDHDIFRIRRRPFDKCELLGDRNAILGRYQGYDVRPLKHIGRRLNDGWDAARTGYGEQISRVAGECQRAVRAGPQRHDEIAD